jgi:hypothetical protein
MINPVMFRNWVSKWLASGALIACLAASGCGKSVSVGPEDNGTQGTPPSGTTRTSSCDPGSQAHWSFTQPEANERKSIDLLFVVDTSVSMDKKRAQLAKSVSSFVSALDPGTDYRIGVMLAHGAKSSYSGKLYAASGSRVVLDSSQQSAADIQSQLLNSLVNVVRDGDDAAGEAMLASFQKSTTGAKLTKIQSQGFYRNDAALAVIFISDENDICYPPQDHGYTGYPDYVPSATTIEQKAYTSNCLDSSGNIVITPESTLAALEKLKPQGAFSIAGIVHWDPSKVPVFAGSEEAIGHGIVELVDLANKTHAGNPDQELALDITHSDFSSGLSKFGTLTSSMLNLQTVFPLDGQLDPDSIEMSVDQKPVSFVFDVNSVSTRIALKDAGGAGSKVEVSACRVKPE